MRHSTVARRGRSARGCGATSYDRERGRLSPGRGRKDNGRTTPPMVYSATMQNSDPLILQREVEAAVIPVGTRVTLLKGEQARITQSLGGAFTVLVNGNLFRIEGRDADALGMAAPAVPAAAAAVGD